MGVSINPQKVKLFCAGSEDRPGFKHQFLVMFLGGTAFGRLHFSINAISVSRPPSEEEKTHIHTLDMRRQTANVHPET